MKKIEKYIKIIHNFLSKKKIPFHFFVHKNKIYIGRGSYVFIFILENELTRDLLSIKNFKSLNNMEIYISDNEKKYLEFIKELENVDKKKKYINGINVEAVVAAGLIDTDSLIPIGGTNNFIVYDLYNIFRKDECKLVITKYELK